MNLLILGPQGSGKGTQALRLAQRLHVPDLSMGDLLRTAAKAETDLGARIRSFLEQGHLVPAEIAAEVLHYRLDQPDADNGYILDGFPRNMAQYREFSFRQPQCVLLLEIPIEESVARLSSRVVCSMCRQTSSLSVGVQVGANCPCGGVWEHRSDDTPEIIKKRLEIYHNETLSVVDAYERRGLVVRLSGLGTEDEVEQRLVQALRCR